MTKKVDDVTEEKDMNEMLRRKNTDERIILGYRSELATRRQKLMAELKAIRHDDAALEKVLHDTILDDTMSLFPDAGIMRPKSLTDGEGYWMLCDHANKEKTVQLKMEIARVGNGTEFVYQVYAKTEGPVASHKWAAAGRSREEAARVAIAAVQLLISTAQTFKNGQYADQAKSLAKWLSKVEEQVPMAIIATSPDWKPPLIHMRIQGITPAIVQAALCPGIWERNSVPTVEPMPINGKFYVVVQAAPDSRGMGTESEQWLALSVVKQDAWAFKTVAHPDDALDGKWCGLVVEARGLGKFVIDQYSTAYVLWDWPIVEAAELDRGGDLMPAEINDVKRCDHSNMLSDIQKASANPETSVKLNNVGLLFQSEEAFLNIGGGTDVPFGCHLLLPLTTPDAFDRHWPGHIAGRGKGKAANWVGLHVQAHPRAGDAKLHLMRVCGLESGIAVRIKGPSVLERIQTTAAEIAETPKTKTKDAPWDPNQDDDAPDSDVDDELEETRITDKPQKTRGRPRKAVKFGKPKK